MKVNFIKKDDIIAVIIIIINIIVISFEKTFQRFLISIINDYYRVLNRLGTRIRLSYEPEE